MQDNFKTIAKICNIWVCHFVFYFRKHSLRNHIPFWALVLAGMLCSLPLGSDRLFFLSCSDISSRKIKKRCSFVKCSLQYPYYLKTVRPVLSGETYFRNNYLCIGVKQTIHCETEIPLGSQAHAIK